MKNIKLALSFLLSIYGGILYGQSTDAQLTNLINTNIRTAATVTRANHSNVEQAIVDSKLSVLGVYTTSGTNTYTVNVPASVTSYVANQIFPIRFATAATGGGPFTLNINGLGAKTLVKQGNTAVVASDIKIGQDYIVIVDGTNIQLVGGGGSAGAGGDMLAANNLSDVLSVSSARTNLGATTVGGNLFTATNPSAVTWIRVNADNTLSFRNAAQTLSDIGAQATGSYLSVGNNLSDVASVSTSRTNLGLGTFATLNNPMTTTGDVIIGGASGAPTRLAATTNGFVLTLVGGSPAWQASSGGGGNMLSANNLSDVASVATSRTNLGATTAGANIFTVPNPSAITWVKINADNTVSTRTAAQTVTDLGVLTTANNLSDVASAATSRGNLGATTVGGNIFTATNPSAVRWVRVNADNTITFRTALETLTDIGLDTDGTMAANSDAKVPSQKAVVTYVGTQALGPFSTVAPGYTNLSGSAGGLLKHDNTWLAIGANNTVLTSNGSAFSWVAPAAAPSVATFAEALAGTNDTKIVTPLKNAYVNPRVYNVKAYGALGDGRLVTDGSITSGAAILTSTVGGFLSTDVGNFIKVGGAGAAGVDLITTILSYTSSTQVTLNTNASTTVSGVARIDWGHDDTAAIQSAIAACVSAGVGGTVYFPIGVYTIAGALVTSVGADNPNAQLYIPSFDYKLATVPGVIFQGETVPVQWNDQLTAGIPARTTGTILKSTIVGANTRPSVIGCAITTGYSFNPVPITFRNITIQTRNMTSNAAVTPSMSAFNFIRASVFNAYDCTAQIEGPLFSSIEPTIANVTGFAMPGINSAGPAGNILNNCSVQGYYTGIELSDHSNINQCWVEVCRYAYLFSQANQPIYLRSMLSFENKYDYVFTGPCTLVCEGSLNIEENGTTGRWNDNVYNFYAPSGSATVYGMIRFNLNQQYTLNGTFTGTFFENIYQGESPHYAVVGGGAFPRFGGTAEWVGPSATGAESKAVFEIRGRKTEAGNTDYTDFVMSHSQTGTNNLVSRQVVYNNGIVASDHRLKDVEVYTDGAINKGREEFYYHDGTAIRLAFTLASDRVIAGKQFRLPAGTTAAGTAPLLWASGSLMTTPVAGAAEFLTDKWYGTITTGTARKEFTLNDAALTSGTVPVATTNGRLTDSGITTATGDATFGSGLSGANRTLTATGSATDVGFIITTKGNNGLTVGTVANNLVDHQFNQVGNFITNHYSTDAVGTTLSFSKLRGTFASPTTIANSDVLANIDFKSYDGTASFTTAQIKSVINGTVATNTLPTDLVFSTTTTNSLTEQLRIKANGGIVVPSTVTAGGTTGNQTINKTAGTVNIAAAGTTVTVTNSLVTTSSIVLCVIRTNDSTATLKNVVPGSGSFVITLTAGATSEVSIGFVVIN